MSKKTYLGVSNIAHQVKKAYIGVNGVARKIKKIYLGVAGIAKQIFGGGDIEYKGTNSSPLSVARYYMANANVGNYTVFGGGYASFDKNTVDAFDILLTRTNPKVLPANARPAGVSIGNYALFAGGCGNAQANAVVCAYDTSLTRSSPSAMGYIRSYYPYAVSVGNYAVIYDYSLSYVYIYDTSLTQTTATKFVDMRYGMGVATVGNYGLFAGGTDGTVMYTNVYTVNASLTFSTASSIDVGAKYIGGASMGGRFALIAGGINTSLSNERVKKAYAYNQYLTKTNLSDLTSGHETQGIANESFALFNNLNVLDAYDESLTKFTPTQLNIPRYFVTGAKIDNKILLAGGYNNSVTDIIDIYEVG